MVRFIYNAFRKQQGTLNADWASFNLGIGIRGANIDPRALVNFNETEAAAPVIAGTEPMSDQEVQKYMIAICAIYRLGQITREEYKYQVERSRERESTP